MYEQILQLKMFRDYRTKYIYDAFKNGNPHTGAKNIPEDQKKSKQTKTSSFELAAGDRHEVPEKELDNMRIPVSRPGCTSP